MILLKVSRYSKEPLSQVRSVWAIFKTQYKVEQLWIYQTRTVEGFHEIIHMLWCLRPMESRWDFKTQRKWKKSVIPNKEVEKPYEFRENQPNFNSWKKKKKTIKSWYLESYHILAVFLIVERRKKMLMWTLVSNASFLMQGNVIISSSLYHR